MIKVVDSDEYDEKQTGGITISVIKLKGCEGEQEDLAVASIARDDPSPLPSMHRDHNAPACTASPHPLRLAVRAGALCAATAMRGKFR